ncbi:MAG TPA: hypothetical protein PLK35_00480 [Candidatus Moranbacteria bacterium]|nr:hypothetical protein [Candidatus Moranbacteria bacterium]
MPIIERYGERTPWLESKHIEEEKMKKVLWFSRHELSPEQLADLKRIFGEVEVNQINQTINHASEIKADIEAADVIAIVAPLPLQQEFLQLSGVKPVIFCKNARIVDPVDNTKVTFQHTGWFRIKEIKVVFEPL